MLRPVLLASLAVGALTFAGAGEIPLSQLDISQMTQGYKKPQKDKSVYGTPLQIAGEKFETGVGTHATSRLYIELDGKAERFVAKVGLDDSATSASKDKNASGSVEFQVLTDGKVVFDSGVMKSGNKAKTVDVPLKGVRVLLLRVSDVRDGRNYDHADWADAKIITDGAQPVAVASPSEPAVILTPKPGPEPRINAPVVYGARPGHPFLYRIPVTGNRPMEFSAEGLPEGLKLDGATGIITGTTPAAGDYAVTLKAKNSAGEATKAFTIKAGDKLALTPYMGWNDWYAFYHDITDEKMRGAADAMVKNGMADFGYDYVCIDDCWMKKPNSDDPALSGDQRDAKGNILPNAHFPDMKAMTDYIHSKGLKTGIYTSPGPLTCGGYMGSFEHEALDAKQFADWGFDLLKYDWCSYGKVVKEKQPWGREVYEAPYTKMGNLVKQQDRDIIFNLCQYGMDDVWEWGEDVQGHSWRTAGDLGPSLNNFITVAVENVKHRAWNGPGTWNDPDYLQIGKIGIHSEPGALKPCPLTPSEQYTFMSLWCLMASPLMYSGDVSQMDEFTLNVLCNAEVIEVNQDPMGQCGAMADLGNDCFMLVKDMSDGSKAVGLCNGSETTATLTGTWAAIGVHGPQVVRDLWRQKDIGTLDGKFEAEVPRHGTAFVRVRAAK